MYIAAFYNCSAVLGEGVTHVSLHVDETEALGDVVTEHHDIGVQQPPVLRARCIIELQPVLVLAQLDFKDEGLVNVAEKRDRIDALTDTQPPSVQY
jgi:hypothetical protein